MRPGTFPDPLTCQYDEWVRFGDYIYRSDDVVAYGTELTPANVREAYQKGIFPWYTEGLPLPWHCPEKRAILEFADLSIPRSLKKAQRKVDLRFTIDRDFAAVMRECSQSLRPGQLGTWITTDFERVYGQLHVDGIAHSIEAWSRDGELVGGLYGIDAGGVFCGESMFYKAPNASKLALLFLIDHLRSRGATWLDSQVMTPHMEALGAKEITREIFLQKLAASQAEDLKLFQT